MLVVPAQAGTQRLVAFAAVQARCHGMPAFAHCCPGSFPAWLARARHRRRATAPATVGYGCGPHPCARRPRAGEDPAPRCACRGPSPMPRDVRLRAALSGKVFSLGRQGLAAIVVHPHPHPHPHPQSRDTDRGPLPVCSSSPCRPHRQPRDMDRGLPSVCSSSLQAGPQHLVALAAAQARCHGMPAFAHCCPGSFPARPARTRRGRRATALATAGHGS